MDKKRYESIMKRDFKYNLELFIFDHILHDNVKNATPEKFKDFKPGDELANKYRKACQQKSGDFEKTTIEKIDKDFIDWYTDRDLKEYKDIFFTEFAKKFSINSLT